MISYSVFPWVFLALRIIPSLVHCRQSDIKTKQNKTNMVQWRAALCPPLFSLLAGWRQLSQLGTQGSLPALTLCECCTSHKTTFAVSPVLSHLQGFVIADILHYLFSLLYVLSSMRLFLFILTNRKSGIFSYLHKQQVYLYIRNTMIYVWSHFFFLWLLKNKTNFWPVSNIWMRSLKRHLFLY